MATTAGPPPALVFCGFTWVDAHTRPDWAGPGASRHRCVKIDAEGFPRHRTHACCCGEEPDE